VNEAGRWGARFGGGVAAGSDIVLTDGLGTPALFMAVAGGSYLGSELFRFGAEGA